MMRAAYSCCVKNQNVSEAYEVALQIDNVGDANVIMYVQRSCSHILLLPFYTIYLERFRAFRRARMFVEAATRRVPCRSPRPVGLPPPSPPAPAHRAAHRRPRPSAFRIPLQSQYYSFASTSLPS